MSPRSPVGAARRAMGTSSRLAVLCWVCWWGFGVGLCFARLWSWAGLGGCRCSGGGGVFVGACLGGHGAQDECGLVAGRCFHGGAGGIGA